MRKKLACLIVMCSIFALMCPVAGAAENVTRIYVSENGSDAGEGSFESPYQTIFHARDVVRGMIADGLTSDVEVVIRGGVYIMPEVWRMLPEDSGNNGYTVTWKGYENEFPLISAGIEIDGFEELENGMWKTTVPEADLMMEMYVNDTRVYRAAMEYEVYGEGDWNDPNTAYPYDGIYFSKKILNNIAHPEDLVLRAARAWKGSCARATGMIQDPEDESRNILLMNQAWTILRSGTRWSHTMNPFHGFKIENAFEFLDSPGEYYFDKRTKELWYLPREGETIDTVKAYAPNLQYALLVKGHDGELTKNLNFEGLRFAHASYETPDYIGFTHGQASETFVSRSFEEINTPAGVTVWYADNIHFKNCIIFGMGADGLNMGISVSNSSAEGCAVYDTGGCGMVAGSSMQSADGKLGRYIMSDRVDMFARSYRTMSDLGPSLPGYSLYEAEAMYWHPYNDVNTGTKSWVRFDFDEAVSLSEITLAPGLPDSPGSKSNFEIIASTDPDFAEYDVLYTQGASPYPGDQLSITKNLPDKKYRYVMVRKTKVEEFSLSYIHMYTDDLKVDSQEISKNITYRDNYITRTGNYYYGSVGMLLYDVANFKAQHNEICKTTYSGMSVGWFAGLVEDDGMEISNNYIHDFMYKSQDGGGIYTLGVQSGAKMIGNRIGNQIKHNGAIYNDLTSVNFYMSDTLMEYVPNNFWTGLTGDRQITATNIFSTTTKQLFATAKDGAPTSVIDPIQLVTEGNLPPAAQKIADEAGITEENLWIKELVPDNTAYFEKDRIGWFFPMWSMGAEYDAGDVILRRADLSSGKDMSDLAEEFAQSAKTLLENNYAGELLGEYDAAAVLELRDAIEGIGQIESETDKNKIGQTERYLKFMDAYQACVASLKRGSLSETLKQAEELLKNEGGKATKDNRERFETEIAEIKSNAGGEDEYARLVAAEKAMIAFDNSLGKTEMKGFKLVGIDGRTVIDQKAKTVTVFVTPDVDLTACRALLETSEGCRVYPDFDQEQNYSYPVQAVLQNGNAQTAWTINVVKQYADEWRNRLDGTALPQGNSVTLEHSIAPYIYAGEKKNDISLKISASSLDNDKGTAIIFDSPSVQLLRDGLAEKHTHYELILYRDYLELAQFFGGVKKIIFGGPYDKEKDNEEIFATADYLNPDGSNDIHIVTKQVGNDKNIIIDVNGKRIFNGLCASATDADGGYIGIYSYLADVAAEVA